MFRKIWKKSQEEAREPSEDEEEEDQEPEAKREMTREERLEYYRNQARQRNLEERQRASAPAKSKKPVEERDEEERVEEEKERDLVREVKKPKENKFSLKSLFSRFTEKKEITDTGDDDVVAAGSKWSLPKVDTMPQMLLLIGLMTVILVVLLRVGTITVLPKSLQPQTQESAKPLVQPLTPLDVKNADWVAPLQQVLIIEALAFYALTVADARKRKQLSDAVAVTVALVVVFAPVIPLPGGNLGNLFKMLGFEGTSSVVLGTTLVLWATFAGGRDFTPLGCYLGLIGMGGILFGSLGEVSIMLHLDPSSSVLSLSQVKDLIILKTADKTWMSTWIYLLLSSSFVVLITEVLRPAAMEQAGDKGPTIGTLFSMSLGVAAYLVARLGIVLEPPPSFVIALACALTVGGLTQNEKLPQFIPGSWSVRTMYDSATLMTSGLVLVHVILGVA